MKCQYFEAHLFSEARRVKWPRCMTYFRRALVGGLGRGWGRLGVGIGWSTVEV